MNPVRSRFVGALALLAGLGLSTFAYRQVQLVEQETANRKFDARTAAVTDFIGERFFDYEQLLRAGVALFNTDSAVSRADWNRFVSTLQVTERYPGTQGLGYARWLRPEQVGDLVAQVRAEGYPEFELHPAGSRDHYGVIVYLEPFDLRNRRAFGYDMFSQSVRREAMQRAIDTGDASLTGRVTLVQETEVDQQAGTLLYLPVYAGGGVPATQEERRQSIIGFVYSPLRMNDLISGVLGHSFDDLKLRIVDSAESGDADLLFRSPNLTPSDLSPSTPRWTRTLKIGGHHWKVEAFPAQPLVTGWSRALLILLGGALISLLVAILLWSATGARDRAVALARSMTQALRRTQERQQAVLDSAVDAILTVNARMQISSANHAMARMFGRTVDDLRDTEITRLLPEFPTLMDDVQSPQTAQQSSPVRRETLGRRANDQEFPAEVTISPLSGEVDAEGGAVVVTIRDLTLIRQAQAALAAAHSLRESILSHAPFAVIAVDTDLRVAEINPAAEALLWYRKDELVGRGNLGWILGTDSADDGKTQSVIDNVLSPVRRGQVDEREWSYQRKDGSRVLVNQVVTALRDEVGAVTGFLVIAYDITERKRTEDYIRHLAHHDALTELPNRALCTDRLEVAMAQARRTAQKVGVLMIDLDHFKRINDSLGHHVGDELLIQVTSRLRHSVREGDTVARMGGDEFVVVLPGISDQEDALRVARTLVDVLPQPISVGAHELHVTPSVGVCLYPDDGADTITLLKNADTAMYHAKEHGRNRYSLFSQDMLRASESKMAMESALRRAIARKRLLLHYQPLVSLGDGEVTGMEALLRWPDDKGGFIPPDVFIPIAEETGLINQMADGLLGQACADAMLLSQQLARPLGIAVNISPKQFHNARLIDVVRSALQNSGLPPQLLTLEVTERMLIGDPADAAEVLRGLRHLGVGVAIDDFGTGYSSLAYISQFPISKLKIDRSFIRDLGEDTADTAVINAIIAMGRSMHLQVIAEGVETAAQRDYLRARGCHEVQGFMFSPGVPVAEFAQVVTRIERSNPQPAVAQPAIVQF
ncbi:EAL domain-containing protein [Sinimarinibacterium sp. CAU 1509]|uniref:bifunctional diguanylate cyclase/phosphodiesterase n=1 Tax=Sinimarinibacterium sp. CAU 1509 TaxID=2562283 RepID=UPI0010AD9888|nr:EAL domain-containing protein [Sinimarinibacterium sp. CAU 1509]TJY62039.1 EAL domain-containing protein [Sinimarinibacterium sp. CAU 1509]